MSDLTDQGFFPTASLGNDGDERKMIHCRRCGSLIERLSATHKYCESCAPEARKQSQNKWRETYRWDMSRASRERGIIASAERSQSLIGMLEGEFDPQWVLKISLPFAQAASKNLMYGKKKRGDRFIVKDAKKYRKGIIDEIALAARGIKVKQNKLWIGIFIEKPHHRGDAINFIDFICDAVKRAIPLDDRWYCIRRLDWAVNKHDPKILIELSQDFGVEDSKCCRYCGGIKPLPDFTKSVSEFDGRGSVCSSCRLGLRRIRAE